MSIHNIWRLLPLYANREQDEALVIEAQLNMWDYVYVVQESPIGLSSVVHVGIIFLITNSERI